MANLEINNMLERLRQKSPGSTEEEVPVIRDCEKHGQYEAKWKTNFRGERHLYDYCPECAREEREREEEEERRERMKVCICYAQFPLRHSAFSFDDFQPETEEQRFALRVARGYAEGFSGHYKQGRNLVLVGRPGTGKTSLACAIGRAIIKASAKRLVIYSTEHGILRDLKGTWRRNAEFSEEEVLQHFVDIPLLIIDEVGVSGNSDTDRALIHQVIDGRYGEVKPTLIVGNLTIEELNQHLGERIMDRLKEGGGVVVPFTWGSFRK